MFEEVFFCKSNLLQKYFCRVFTELQFDSKESGLYGEKRAVYTDSAVALNKKERFF